MKIAIIGGGHMGYAFARCFVARGIITLNELSIFEAQLSRCHELAREIACNIYNSVDSQLSKADVVVLAVKPQDMEEACKQCHPFIKPEQLIISIAAGITLKKLDQYLQGHRHIVRSMPNLTAQIAQGITVYMIAKGADRSTSTVVEKILNAVGLSVGVTDEDLIDAATAISGTGPGYLYYIIEHVLEAACSFGFSKEQSQTLVLQTFKGALALWETSGKEAHELRSMVTSKRGTTEAAVKVFEAGGLGKTLIEGIKRAKERSRELAESKN